MVTAVIDVATTEKIPVPTRKRLELKETPQVRTLPASTAEDLVQLFKLLSDETRLQILYFLMQESELNVGMLCDLLAQSQPAVSHHLALLRVAHLIETRRQGKHNFYRLQPSQFAKYREVLLNVCPGMFPSEPPLVDRPADRPADRPTNDGASAGSV